MESSQEKFSYDLEMGDPDVRVFASSMDSYNESNKDIIGAIASF
jgi:hypothetical protein